MGWFTWLFHIYTDGHKSGHRSPFLRCFSCKTAFLKSKFKDDPVRVQRHTVRHFKDFEEIFKMTYSTSLNFHWIGLHQPSKLNIRKKPLFYYQNKRFFRTFNFDGWWRLIQWEFRDVLYVILKIS